MHIYASIVDNISYIIITIYTFHIRDLNRRLFTQFNSTFKFIATIFNCIEFELHEYMQWRGNRRLGWRASRRL